MRWLLLLGVIGCGAPTAAPVLDAPPDSLLPDATIDPDGPIDPQDPTAGWARYSIAPGAHTATITTGVAGNPRNGFVTGLGTRSFDLALDASAIYTITNPAQPTDQLDWNKLPGLSDCGTFDLSDDGLMFGWRWRLDTVPQVLEVTAYANNAGTHLTPTAPLIVLDADDLASVTPLHYELVMDGALYRFTIAGTIRGRAIDVAATLPRRCGNTTPGSLLVQWAGGIYFGGTSTAPSAINARVFEP
jgi:hypothetical protein